MKFRASLHKLLIAFLVLFAPILGGVRPAQAAAQQPQTITLESVRVDVWPEYDQPSVLVIYNVTIASTVNLPATLTVRIPAAVGKPHAVAMQDVSGLYVLNYTTNRAGDWLEVKFTTPSPDVRVEFYDTTLTKSGAHRTYTFHWPADYTVKNLSVKVQQPVNATNVTFRPDIGAGRADSDGLTYYTLTPGKVDAGTAFDLTMGYDKADDTLTNPQQFQAAQPSQPVDGNTPGRVKLFQGATVTTLQLVMIILGLALILGGGAWYGFTSGGFTRFQRGFNTARAGNSATNGRKRHTHPSVAGQAADSAVTGEAAFCQQCGKKAGPGDVFCRSCGTRLRG